jgi:c(7)-type cytochrome triheme protein
MWTMRNLFAYSVLFSLIALTASLAQEKKAPSPPTKLEFAAKTGKVTYDHAAHAKREKNDCKVCHPALWPQDAKAPLNFKVGAMHKGAEAKKTSCAKCHVEGGTAFAAKGNCTGKCHNNAKKG